jgi:hypothetical protein
MKWSMFPSMWRVAELRPKKPPENVNHFTFFSPGLAYRWRH